MAGTVTQLPAGRKATAKPAARASSRTVPTAPSVPAGLRKPATRPRRNADLALAEAVRNAYKSYVMFHSDLYEAQLGTLVLFTFHTFVYELAQTTPYLLVSSPTSESGKSTVFDVARLLIHRPFVVADPTPASLFGAIDALKPLSLLVDEADMLRQNAGLKAVLNVGFQRNAPPIIRAKKVYYCYCPKMFAGITGEKPPLTGATLSRCVQINIRRKSQKETDKFKLRSFDYDEAEEELTPVHGKLEQWAIKSRDSLRRPKVSGMPAELSDRQRDMWKQLFAIADLLGGNWGKNARKWAVELAKAIPKQVDPAIQILADVKNVLDEYVGDSIPTHILADRRNMLTGKEFEAPLTGQQLGRRLSGFGLLSTQYRDENGAKTRGYKIRDRKGNYLPLWADAFDRYRV